MIPYLFDFQKDLLKEKYKEPHNKPALLWLSELAPEGYVIKCKACKTVYEFIPRNRGCCAICATNKHLVYWRKNELSK